MFVLPCRELEEAVLCGDTLPTADGHRLDLSVSFNASYTGLISFHLAVGPLAEFNRPESTAARGLNLLRDGRVLTNPKRRFRLLRLF
jgi:hypothetical protein